MLRGGMYGRRGQCVRTFLQNHHARQGEKSSSRYGIGTIRKMLIRYVAAVVRHARNATQQSRVR